MLFRRNRVRFGGIWLRQKYCSPHKHTSAGYFLPVEIPEKYFIRSRQRFGHVARKKSERGVNQIIVCWYTIVSLMINDHECIKQQVKIAVVTHAIQTKMIKTIIDVVQSQLLAYIVCFIDNYSAHMMHSIKWCGSAWTNQNPIILPMISLDLLLHIYIIRLSWSVRSLGGAWLPVNDTAQAEQWDSASCDIVASKLESMRMKTQTSAQILHAVEWNNKCFKWRMQSNCVEL